MNYKTIFAPIALLFVWVCVVACPQNQDSQAFQLPQSLLKIHESKSHPNAFDAESFRSTLRSEGEFWLKHKKILFLGEGSSEWTGKWAEQHMSFAEILKSEYPHMDIWAADLEVPIKRNKDIHVIAVDHRSPFPAVLKDHTFDAVIAMRILCHCRRDNAPSDNMMCGGIHSHEKDYMKQLLNEVIETLDPHNSASFGFLEGEERNRQKHNWIDDIIEAAQLESKKSWAIAIDEANQSTNQFYVSIVPTEEDASLRKAILIRAQQ